jgi:hypothetical protein
LRNGWKIWNKYCHLFNNQNIIFWEENDDTNKTKTLLLIANKKKIIECLESQEEEFKSGLKTDFINPVSLLEQRPFFSSALKK